MEMIRDNMWKENGVTTKDPLHNLNGTLFDQNGHIPYTQMLQLLLIYLALKELKLGTTISLTEGSSLTKEVKIDIREKVDDAMEMNNEGMGNILYSCMIRMNAKSLQNV
ncbi:hypothetical protein CK203_105680 [Vitis vinifera]|uniref:Uncharacterized protein n=1 Tax=Vitis vinifera TaxID=29760 RepID=A0A438DCR5_VITVI|nr:hypothetical protein CK203_105680 [Vitis vinifera]